MGTIAVSNRLASTVIALSAAVAALLCTITGCSLPPDLPGEYPLAVYPTSALRGNNLQAEITVYDLDLSACGKASDDPENTAPSLQFTSTAGSSREDTISVLKTSIISASRLGAEIQIAADAPTGSYRVILHCGTAVRQGSFHVSEPSGWPTVTMRPGSLSAGEQAAELDISLDYTNAVSTLFVQGQSRVLFGEDSGVVPFGIRVAEDGRSLTVSVAVSEFSVAPGQPARSVPVSVVTGAEVAIGTLQINPPDYPKLRLSPDSGVRPSATETPRVLSVLATVENMVLRDADPDEPSPADFAVRVEDNPGIRVLSATVISPTEVDLTLEIDPAADVRAAAIVLSASGESAAAAFAVIPALPGSGILLHPPTIDNCEWTLCARQLVVLEARGWVLAEDASVSVNSTEVTINESVRLSEQTLAVWLTPSNGSLLDQLIVTVTSDGRSEAAVLRIRDVNGQRLRALPNLVQGAAGTPIVLTMESGTMSASAIPVLSPRQGVWYERAFDFEVNDTTRQKRGVLIENHRALPDAPAGPAMFNLTGGGDAWEAWYRVLPSGTSPTLALSSDVLWLNGPAATVEVTGVNGMIINNATRFMLSDPRWQITTTSIDVATNSAQLQIRGRPSALPGLAHLYARTGTTKAAAALRGVSHAPAWTVNGISGRVFRQNGIGTISVPVIGEFTQTAVGVSFLDGIGIRVERVLLEQVFDSRIKVTVSLDAEGPGGWTGMVLSMDGRSLIVPVEIVATNEDGLPDDSLTLHLNPANLTPGSVHSSVVATVSDSILTRSDDGANRFYPLSSDMTVQGHGVYAQLSSVSDNGASATALISLAWSVQPSASLPGAAVMIRTPRGAHVGFLQVLPEDELTRQTSEIGKTLEYFFAENRNVLISAQFNPPAPGVDRLVYFRGSHRSEDYSDLSVDWLSPDYLTAAASMQGGELMVLGSGAINLRAASSGYSFLSSRVLGPVGFLQSDEDPCQTPILYVGRFTQAAEVFEQNVTSPGPCRFKATAVARRLDPSPWATPDLRLRVCSSATVCPLENLDAAAATEDPSLYFDADADNERVQVSAEMGTEGVFMLNVRGVAIIARVSRQTGNQFIELEMEPEMPLDNWSLLRSNPDTGLPLGPPLLLSGTAPANGRVIIAESGFAGVTVVDTEGMSVFVGNEPFLLALRNNGTTADSLQVGGTFDGAGQVEGLPVENGIFTCFARLPGNIDTNDNRFDFSGGWSCSL